MPANHRDEDHTSVDLHLDQIELEGKEEIERRAKIVLDRISNYPALIDSRAFDQLDQQVIRRTSDLAAERLVPPPATRPKKKPRPKAITSKSKTTVKDGDLQLPRPPRHIQDWHHRRTRTLSLYTIAVYYGVRPLCFPAPPSHSYSAASADIQLERKQDVQYQHFQPQPHPRQDEGLLDSQPVPGCLQCHLLCGTHRARPGRRHNRRDSELDFCL